MKINDKEIDMQHVVRLYEKEMMSKNEKRINSIREYWKSTAGDIQREKQAERMRIASKNGTHRKKIKFKLIDVDTRDVYNVTGTAELANFLGYKRYNSSLMATRLYNRDKTHEFIVERED